MQKLRLLKIVETRSSYMTLQSGRLLAYYANHRSIAFSIDRRRAMIGLSKKGGLCIWYVSSRGLLRKSNFVYSKVPTLFAAECMVWAMSCNVVAYLVSANGERKGLCQTVT